MKYVFFLLFFVNITYAQKATVALWSSIDEIVGVDNLENIYYTKNNTLYKKTENKINSYTNIHLGKITKVDISNPLKIVVFYVDYNSVVILDNELNELTDIIDFNIELNKNILFVGVTNNSSLWLYCKDDNSLQIWDYHSKKTRIEIPIQSNESYTALCSNKNNIWLISPTEIIQYNSFGSYTKQIQTATNTRKAIAYKNDIVYATNNQLHYYYKDSNTVLKEDFEKVKFYIAEDTIYYFDGKSINTIKIPKN